MSEDRWWEKKKEVATVWQACKTPEGVDYYYNTDTNETTWDKPEELMTEDEKGDAGEWYWVPDPEHEFVPAKLVQANKDGTKLKVELENGEERKVKLKECEPLSRASLQRVVEDLVLLDRMSHPLILHNINKRFQKNLIYTNVGTIVIAVNPYQRLPIYTEEVKDKYIHRGTKTEMPPHVFNVGFNAFKKMKDFSENQSIIISGESGAGKTETTKQCLNFISTCAGSVGGIEKKVLQANPILEAFGNAKTIRNDNSSRFGKYMQIFFNNNNQMCSSDTRNYLLEKIRVVSQGPNERNYHIFYQLCSSRSSASLSPLKLRDVDSYGYLTGGQCTSVASIDDVREFDDVQQAFKDLEFKATEVQEIYELCAAVLKLGDVKFSGHETKTDVDMSTVAPVAELFKVDPTALSEALTIRMLKIRGQDPTPVNLAPDVASGNRDALAKFVYGNLFDWLVIRVNEAMGDTSKLTKYIGILDIFGFEIFEHNSFEQLCINFTNEMLQQHFNTHTFKLEEQIYKAEKIKFKHVEFTDNQPMVDLIKKRPHGIMPLLDEELRVPRGSDKGFIGKLHEAHSRNRVYKRFLKNPQFFVVKHYAGEVLYDSDGFLEKNRDTLTSDLMDLVQSSHHNLLKKIFPDSGGGKKASLGKQFCKQLDNLMVTLNQTAPHYIRCVKPNQNKSSTEFNGKMCLEQLTYSGVFEAVAIRKQGYPFRLEHAKFASHYAPITDGKGSGTMDKCKVIISELKLDMNNVQIGKTQVLYRADEYKKLELIRGIKTAKVEINENLERLAAIQTSSMNKQQKDDYMKDLARGVRRADDFRIQSAVAEKCRDLLEEHIAARIDPQTKRELQEAIDSMDKDMLEAIVFKCNKNGFRTKATRKASDLLEKVTDAEAAIAAALGEMDEEYLAKAIEMCDAFNYQGPNAQRCREVLAGIIKAKRQLQSAIATKDHVELKEVLALCDNIGYNAANVSSARSLLARVLAVRKACEQAIAAVAKAQLDAAIQQAVDLDYESDLTRQTKVLSDRVNLIAAEIDKCSVTLEEAAVRVCYQAGTEIKMTDQWLDYFGQLINGPYPDFLTAQFGKAMEGKNVDRAIRIAIKQKDLICQTGGKSDPARYHNLREAMEWSQARFLGMGKDGRVAHFFTWQSDTIHSNITKPINGIADKPTRVGLKKMAIQYFACLQMQCGAKPKKMVEQKLAAALQAALKSQELRVEFYMQIFKMLRNGLNKNAMFPDSNQKDILWTQLALLLCTFPPPADLEIELDKYIREEKSLSQKHRCEGLIRRIVIKGETKSPASASDLSNIASYLSGQNLNAFNEPVVQNPSYGALKTPYAPYVSSGNRPQVQQQQQQQQEIKQSFTRRASTKRESVAVPPTAPPPAQAEEEDPWQAVVDEESNDVYYWNSVTNQTQWDPPPGSRFDK